MSRGAAAALGLGLFALLPLARLVAHADPTRGERVFQRCYACHSVVAGEENLAGPSLRCVLGRPAGAVPGFRYSPAMLEAGAAQGLVWTRATLDAFLADQQRLVPGTAMWIPPLTVPEDRRDLIDYLASVEPCANAGPTPMPR